MLEDRFAKRARRYRAQRGRYAVHFQAAFVIALLLVISAFQLRIYPDEAASITLVQQELVTMEEIVQTRQLVKPPPPPRPPVPVEVPDDEIIEDDDLDLDATLDIDEPLVALPPPPLPAEEVEEEEEPEDEIFVVVEQMPEMIGGWQALLADLKYPQLARQAGLEGMVVVKVLIDQTGTPSNPQVVKSVHEVLDNAAIEAVLKQRFEPGRQRNRPVRVEMAIPVRFQLTDASG